MSVYIKGMEMPKTCHCCRMCVQVADGDIDWHWECCLLCEKVARYATDRIPGCPLVPVPPHGDLVDKQRMAETNEQHYKIFEGEPEADYAREVVLRMLDQAPTIIPAEEVE